MAITFAAGQEVSAADLNALVPKYIRKATDESVTSSVVVQDDNDFVVTIGANETWIGDLYLDVFSASATPDIQCDWAVTGTCTIDNRWIMNLPAGETDPAGAATFAFQVRAESNDVSAAAATSTTTRTAYKETVQISGGASGGTVKFRWAQNTSNATATTVKAGSFFIAHRVS